MKRKSAKIETFIEGLHEFIVTSPQYRKRNRDLSEARIQTEIRPLIIRYLENHFTEAGYIDAIAKANRSFYWEGEQGAYGRKREKIFGSRNYPDFIITKPYLIAIEYKQSQYGSMVKQLLGQSIMHTLCEEYDFVYCLFHDQSKDKRIEGSIGNDTEADVLRKMWADFNIFVRFV